MPGSQRELWGSRREGRAEPFAGEQPRVTGSGAPSPPLPAQDALLECVTRKVPVLLSRGMARLVVIDSVAAPFRCEFDAQASVPRARRLQALGAALRRLSHAFQSPVLCINQVSFRLGHAWVWWVWRGHPARPSRADCRGSGR